MKRIIFIFLIIISITCAGQGLAADAMVRAEGMAQKAGDNSDVKAKAIGKALKNAVSSALDALLKESPGVDPAVINSNIFSNPGAYVLNYRVLSEGWITHMESVPGLDSQDSPVNQTGIEVYHIWVEASVDTVQLKNMLNQVSHGEGAASPVTVDILDVADYRSFNGLVSALKGMTMVKEVSYDTFYSGRVTLTLKAFGNVQALISSMPKEVTDKFVIMPGGSQTIIIKPLRPVASR